MIKKDITFENFEGATVTKPYYFHLGKKKLVDMQVSRDGGMVAYLEGVVKSGDPSKILKTFGMLVASAYGVRGDDDTFIQSEELSSNFMNSLAFDALFTELLMDEKAMAEFFNGVVPKDMAQSDEAIQKLLAESKAIGQAGTATSSDSVKTLEDSASGLKNPRDAQGDLLPWAFRKPTEREIQTMTQMQLQDVSVRSFSAWVPPEPLTD